MNIRDPHPRRPLSSRRQGRSLVPLRGLRLDRHGSVDAAPGAEVGAAMSPALLEALRSSLNSGRQA